MADPHQLHSLIASAISDCSKQNSAGMVYPEEAKIMAKCIVEQLGDAGFHIVVSVQDDEGAISIASGQIRSRTASSANG